MTTTHTLTSEQLSKYKSKSKDSFKTKLQLYLFSKVIQSGDHHEISLAGFRDFRIDEDIVMQYSSEYWQKDKHEKIGKLTIDEIYHAINDAKKRLKDSIEAEQKNYVEHFPEVFPHQDFKKLIEQTCCHYCGVTIQEITTLAANKQLFKKNERGWTLEIDRKNSNLEYRPENCVMACYWCNNAKTDEFTEGEFKQIGQIIKTIWKERLK